MFACKQWVQAFIVVLLAHHHLFATGILQLNQNARQKEELIKYLVLRLEQHRSMSLEEIKKDYMGSLSENQSRLVSEQPFSLLIEKYKSKVNELTSKEDIIAFEQAFIDKNLAAGNYMFYLTRNIDAEFYGRATFGIIFVSIPLDLILLPFQLIVSVLSGF